MTGTEPNGATPGPTEREDEMLRRALAASGDVPPAELARAKALFAFRVLDAELADLTEGELATSDRSAAPLDSMTFSGSGGRIDIEVHQLAGPRARLIGHFVSSGQLADSVLAQGVGVEWSAPVDTLGRFIIEVDRGPLRLQLRKDAQPVFTTQALML